MINNFIVSKIDLNDKKSMTKVIDLLKKYNLSQDIIDNCAVIYDENEIIIATISSFQNTIKCLAIEESYQGNNLANKLVTYMIQEIYKNNWNEILVFIKSEFSVVFRQLGFYEIFKNSTFSFFTNRYDLFNNYLEYLKKEKVATINAAAIVMNANPFTKGHLYLVEKAAKLADFVYIILVKEENNVFSYKQRFDMVSLGIVHINNVKLLHGSNYLVSKNVFPSYFLDSSEEIIKQQTELDCYIFINYVAKCLNITSRFVGTEPLSRTTNFYNETMKKFLPANNIKLFVINRLKINNQLISATYVRNFFKEKKLVNIKPLVPITTFNYLEKIMELKK